MDGERIFDAEYQEPPEPTDVLAAVAEQTPDDYPLPDRFVVTRHTDFYWLVRYEVDTDDQPRIFTVML